MLRRVVHKSTAGILRAIPEAVGFVGNSPLGFELEAVDAKPILNFALRSCMLFNNDSGLGGGG